MEKVTSCTVCLERFSGLLRIPKVLSCGHSLCYGCAQSLNGFRRRSRSKIPCPLCRKVTELYPSDLPVNYAILSLLEEVQLSEPKWCSDCKKVADSTCETHHFTCLWRREQERQFEDVKQYLETAAASQHSLERMLSESFGKLSDVISFLMDEVEASRKDTGDALSLMDSVLGVAGPRWDRARASIEQARLRSELREAFDQQTMSLMHSARKCEVTVYAEHGRSWRGAFDLEQCSSSGASAVVLAVIAAMQRARLLNLAEEVAELPNEGSMAVSRDVPDVGPDAEEVLQNAAGPGDGELVPFPKGQEIDFENIRPGVLFMFVRHQPESPVTSISSLSCKEFLPDVVEILRCHGPTLEGLSLHDVVEDVLVPVLTMPRLKRLELKGWLGQKEDLFSHRLLSTLQLECLEVSGDGCEPPVVEAILRIIGGAQELALQWPVDSTRSLADVIKELSADAAWPVSIKLLRKGSCERRVCNQQSATYKAALPDSAVHCARKCAYISLPDDTDTD
ncbi:uncharacterized protein LOC117645053 [Thrips palmi]|uniref:Uncharacterized protein LOC117645053 n=1 Tax=Thrips palmi TaxID=161013 RepID=A0A6P8ZMM0_THRPL|nr:uncharacterized protein LOC117645053 [Thrips palmi]